jgi:hypothetical protein
MARGHQLTISRNVSGMYNHMSWCVYLLQFNESYKIIMEHRGVQMEDRGVQMEHRGVQMEHRGVQMEDWGVQMEHQGGQEGHRGGVGDIG